LSLRSSGMWGSYIHAPVGRLITISRESMQPADPITTFSLAERITAVFVTEQ
jgi:hypothetical protein